MNQDPFAPNSTSLDEATVPLDEVIQTGIDAALKELHTWIPAQVTKVYPDGFVDVQPLLKRAYIDGQVLPLPTIQHVMVQHPSGADWWIKCPIAVGDVGRACFCERSLDVWGVKGGTVDPKDIRHHSLSDAVFVPGLRPASSALPGNATDMVLHNGSAELTVQKAGTFKLSNGTNELFSLLDQLISTLASANVLTGIGPQPFIATVITKLNQIKTAIDSLKGS